MLYAGIGVARDYVGVFYAVEGVIRVGMAS
jgi:hypothetical protein